MKAPLKPCATPGCPALVPRGSPRCANHEKQKNAARGSWRQRGYSSRWDGPGGIRQRHLQEHPLCVACGAEGRVVAATVVDHIVAWQKGATEAERERLFADPANLQSLCASHHGKKTAAEDGSFGRPRAPRG